MKAEPSKLIPLMPTENVELFIAALKYYRTSSYCTNNDKSSPKI